MTKVYVEIKTTDGYLIHLVCVGFIEYIHVCVCVYNYIHTYIYIIYIIDSKDLLNLGPRVPTNFEEDEGNHDSKFRQIT